MSSLSFSSPSSQVVKGCGGDKCQRQHNTVIIVRGQATYFFVNGCIRAFVYLYLLAQTLVFVIVLFVDGCMSVHYFVRLAFEGYSSCEVQGLAHIRC